LKAQTSAHVRRPGRMLRIPARLAAEPVLAALGVRNSTGGDRACLLRLPVQTADREDVLPNESCPRRRAGVASDERTLAAVATRTQTLDWVLWKASGQRARRAASDPKQA